MAAAAIKPPRAPRTVEQATDLLEQIARLDGEAAAIAANRDAAIANTNATADVLLIPVLEQRAAIAGVIETWWKAAGQALLKGKRKTMQLGGCLIGMKAAPVALTFGNSDDFAVAVERLREERWAKPYVRISYAVDKKATKDALDGKHAPKPIAPSSTSPLRRRRAAISSSSRSAARSDRWRRSAWWLATGSSSRCSIASLASPCWSARSS